MKKDTQRVMVELERELWRQVGIAAAARETTRREIVIDALEKWLGDAKGGSNDAG